MRLSKRISFIRNGVDFSKRYGLLDGISILKRFSTVNFIESCDVAISLGIDSKKSEQHVRGYVLLPHGHGRNVRILALVQGENVSLAKSAGADLSGLDNVIDDIKDKKKKFNVAVATPDVMQRISRLGTILGPRGLMPNPKFGTVSQNIVEVITKIRIGQICYRNDKYGIVHASIGRINFDFQCLKENLESLMIDLKKNKPCNSKGVYIKELIVSSTMGPAVQIDQSTLF